MRNENKMKNGWDATLKNIYIILYEEYGILMKKKYTHIYLYLLIDISRIMIGMKNGERI